MIRRAIHLVKTCLVVAAMIALVNVGLSHRVAQPPLSPELAAYVLAGGSLSDLCGTVDGEGHAPVVECEACRISDTFNLLSTDRFPTLVTVKQTFVFEFIAKRIAQSHGLDAVRLVRAPPQA